MLAIVGLLGGLIESVSFSWSVGTVPVAAIVLVVVNFAGCRLAGWGMGTKLGAAVPAIGWVLVVLLLSTRRPEGDLLVTGDTAGYVFIIGGSVAASVAIGLTRSTRSWLLAGATPRARGADAGSRPSSG